MSESRDRPGILQHTTTRNQQATATTGTNSVGGTAMEGQEWRRNPVLRSCSRLLRSSYLERKSSDVVVGTMAHPAPLHRSPARFNRIMSGSESSESSKGLCRLAVPPSCVDNSAPHPIRGRAASITKTAVASSWPITSPITQNQSEQVSGSYPGPYPIPFSLWPPWYPWYPPRPSAQSPGMRRSTPPERLAGEELKKSFLTGARQTLAGWLHEDTGRSQPCRIMSLRLASSIHSD